MLADAGSAARTPAGRRPAESRSSTMQHLMQVLGAANQGDQLAADRRRCGPSPGRSRVTCQLVACYKHNTGHRPASGLLERAELSPSAAAAVPRSRCAPTGASPTSSTSPPTARAASWDNHSPSPAPPRSAREVTQGWNSRSRTSGSTPGPSSATVHGQRAVGGADRTSSPPRRARPCWAAFSTSGSITVRSRCGSTERTSSSIAAEVDAQPRAAGGHLPLPPLGGRGQRRRPPGPARCAGRCAPPAAG